MKLLPISSVLDDAFSGYERFNSIFINGINVTYFNQGRINVDKIVYIGRKKHNEHSVECHIYMEDYREV